MLPYGINADAVAFSFEDGVIRATIRGKVYLLAGDSPVGVEFEWIGGGIESRPNHRFRAG